MITGAKKRFILAATALATLFSCSPYVTVYEDATVVRKGYYYDNTAYLYRYYVIVMLRGNTKQSTYPWTIIRGVSLATP